jgi:hypothetical protein
VLWAGSHGFSPVQTAAVSARPSDLV